MPFLVTFPNRPSPRRSRANNIWIGAATWELPSSSTRSGLGCFFTGNGKDRRASQLDHASYFRHLRFSPLFQLIERESRHLLNALPVKLLLTGDNAH